MKRKKNDEYAYKRGRRSAQGSLPFEAILKNGMLKMGGNTYTLLCELNNAAYLSLTESEQERIYRRYTAALCSLPPDIHYQELLYSRPVDTDELRRLMLPSVTDNEYAAAYAAQLEREINNIAVSISDKRYIAALSYTAANEADDPVSILNKTAAALDVRFREVGSALTPLTADEVIHTLYTLYNPYADVMPAAGTVKDIITPGDVKFTPKTTALGDTLLKVYVAWGYGSTLDDAFITDLLQDNSRVAVGKHIQHLPKEQAIDTLKKRLLSLEGDRQTRLKRNKTSGESYVPLDLERSVNACRELLDKLCGDEELLLTTVLIGVYGRDSAELQAGCELAASRAAAHYVTLKPLTLQQEDALNSLMPYGTLTLSVGRALLGSEAGIMLPFSFPSFIDPNGIFYGKNSRTGEPVIIDRKKDKNGGGFIFGKSGGGKSFYAKLEVSALMSLPWYAGDRIIVVDPHGEFAPLAAATSDSEVLRLAADSGTVINPFGRLMTETVSAQVDYIITFIAALKGDPLTAGEAAVLDRAASQVIGAYMSGGNVPTLPVLDAALATFTEPEAGSIRLYLERYTTGSVKLFAGETTATLGKKLTVYDLSDLSGTLTDIAMLALLTTVWDSVRENYAAGRWTWIYFDELHRYYRGENDRAALQIERLYAEIRKYGGIVTSMTQHPAGVLASPAAASMLTNSQFVVMFEQDGANIEAMADRLQLNEAHKHSLTSADVGCAVLRARGSTVTVSRKYPAGDIVYDTVTTSFADKTGATV